MNRGHKDFQSSALPTELSCQQGFTRIQLDGATFWCHFCSVKPKEAQSSVKSDDRAFEQVFDRQRNRVRGLWLRDDKYFARLDVDGITKRIPLHGAQSVSEAETARQVIKNKIATGEYQAEQAKKLAPEVAPGTEAVDHSIKAAILGYRSTRDKIGGLDPKTGDREDSGLNAWIEFAEKKTLAGLDNIDTLACSDFAEWRRDEAWVLMRARIIVNAFFSSPVPAAHVPNHSLLQPSHMHSETGRACRFDRNPPCARPEMRRRYRRG